VKRVIGPHSLDPNLKFTPFIPLFASAVVKMLLLGEKVAIPILAGVTND
jgi:hypothetical protein